MYASQASLIIVLRKECFIAQNKCFVEMLRRKTQFRDSRGSLDSSVVSSKTHHLGRNEMVDLSRMVHISAIFLIEDHCISIHIPLSVLPRAPTDNKLGLLMAWFQPGDKPQPELPR